MTYSSFLTIFVLFSATPWYSEQCELYGYQSPGIKCLSPSELMSDIKNSKWAWMVEFYASWCPHCQQFVVPFKKLAKELQAWSPVLRIGIFHCYESHLHLQKCQEVGIKSFPMVRFFRPLDNLPLQYNMKMEGVGNVRELKYMLLYHIMSVKPQPSHWPLLEWSESDDFLRVNEVDWKPTVLVFENSSWYHLNDASFVGAFLALDLLKYTNIRVRRVAATNTDMVNQYAVTTFPTILLFRERTKMQSILGNSLPVYRQQILMGIFLSC